MWNSDSAILRDEGRSAAFLSRLERIYLSAIRALALVGATILILYAGWLLISGIYKSSRDVSSVKEIPATVSAAEITDIDLKQAVKSSPQTASDPLAIQKAFYADFSKRYYLLYKNKFESFKKIDDASLDQGAFDKRFVRTSDRLEALKNGENDFVDDKASLESLLATMTAAAVSEKTIDRLRAYKSAKKVPVTRTEVGMRSERYCYYYSDYFGQCEIYDTRMVPYSRKIQEMKLPAGVIGHSDLFGAYQDAYLTKLSAKRRMSLATADRQRQQILEDNATGSAQLWSALRVVGGFVVLMFLFLLIALERHQRKIAAATVSA